jgi:hypothetical protein
MGVGPWNKKKPLTYSQTQESFLIKPTSRAIDEEKEYILHFWNHHLRSRILRY